MTNKELAVLCGCSPATVSKALHNSPAVNKETKARILAEAEKHGIGIEHEQLTYGKIVLVLTPEYNSEWYTNSLNCLCSILWEHGIDMFTMTWNFDEMRLTRLSRLLGMSPNICGIIILDGVSDDLADYLSRIKVPIICAYRQKHHDAVITDYIPSLCRALKHLTENGRKRIGFVGEAKTSTKEKCFRRAMSELGMELDERLVYISEARFAQAGADGFSALFSRDEKPDAIVCGYDYIAFGLLNSADAAGISVPNQLSVIGFDDSIASGVYRLGLSTIGIDHRKRCNALVEMLIHRICKPDEPKKIMVIQSEFISRGTS